MSDFEINGYFDMDVLDSARWLRGNNIDLDDREACRHAPGCDSDERFLDTVIAVARKIYIKKDPDGWTDCGIGKADLDELGF